MRIAAVLMAASLTAIVIAGVAEAKPIESSQEARVVVRTKDLNLATRDGQKRLNRRIRAAAAAVCPAFDIPRQFSPTMLCRREAYRIAALQRDCVVAKAVGAWPTCTADPTRAGHWPSGGEEGEARAAEPIWSEG